MSTLGHCAAANEEDGPSLQGGTTEGSSHDLRSPSCRRQRLEGPQEEGTREETDGAASVMSLLSSVQHRVHAAWTRMGLAERDRHAKWACFLDDSLKPFLRDFLELNEAEERNCIVENDCLLRDLLFLCLRLKESPRGQELRALIQAIEARHQRPGRRISRAVSQTVEGLSHSVSGGADGTNDTQDPISPDSPQLLPSFMSFIPPLANEGSTVSVSDAHDEQSDRGKRPTTGITTKPTPAGGAVERALEQLTRTMTHHEVRRQLQTEYSHLDALADNRLHQLRVVWKQRALLHRPPMEQAELRAVYAKKYLQPGRKTSAAAAGVTAALTSEPRSSSAFASAVSSSEFVKPTTDDEGTEVPSHNAVARGDACRNTDTDELDLLLHAQSFVDASDGKRSTLCLQPRPTVPLPCDTTWPPTCGDVPFPRADPTATKATRDTLFPVDLADLDDYGKRQDLSLERIQREAQEVLQAVRQKNRDMARQVEVELACIRGLYKQVEAVLAPSDGADNFHPALPTLAHVIQEVETRQESFQQEERMAEEAVLASGPYVTPVSSSHSTAIPHSMNSESSARSTALASADGRSSCPITLVHDAEGAPSAVSYLSASVRRLLAAPSYAPVLEYALRVRTGLQQLLLRHNATQLHQLMQELTEAYRSYYTLTQDAHYAMPPKFALSFSETSLSGGVPSGASNSAPLDEWLASPLLETTDTVAELERRQAIAQRVAAQVQSELVLIRERLDILSAAAPLLRDRVLILDEYRDMQEGSRERLLSKRINMAKQLLHEEGVRKRVTKGLPQLRAQLLSLLKRWDEVNIRSPVDCSPGDIGASEGIAGLVEDVRTRWDDCLKVQGTDVRELLACEEAWKPPQMLRHRSAPRPRALSVNSRSHSSTPSPTPRPPTSVEPDIHRTEARMQTPLHTPHARNNRATFTTARTPPPTTRLVGRLKAKKNPVTPIKPTRPASLPLATRRRPIGAPSVSPPSGTTSPSVFERLASLNPNSSSGTPTARRTHIKTAHHKNEAAPSRAATPVVKMGDKRERTMSMKSSSPSPQVENAGTA